MCICMCMLNRRVDILFDKDLWKKVSERAKSQKISAGEFIRKAVREYLDKKIETQGGEKPAPFKGFFKRKS